MSRRQELLLGFGLGGLDAWFQALDKSYDGIGYKIPSVRVTFTVRARARVEDRIWDTAGSESQSDDEGHNEGDPTALIVASPALLKQKERQLR